MHSVARRGASRPLELQKYKRWREHEDRFLEQWAGRLPLEELRRRLIAETGIHRSWMAVSSRLYLLGLEHDAWANDWYRLPQVGELLGMTGGQVWKYVQDGRLLASKQSDRRNAVSGAELDAFIRREPLLFDPGAMPPSRFRNLVDVEQRANGWLSVEQVAELLGLSTRTNTGRVAHMCQAGRIPATRGRRGSGKRGRPRWWIRRSDALAYVKAREIDAAS